MMNYPGTHLNRESGLLLESLRNGNFKRSQSADLFGELLDDTVNAVPARSADPFLSQTARHNAHFLHDHFTLMDVVQHCGVVVQGFAQPNQATADQDPVSPAFEGLPDQIGANFFRADDPYIFQTVRKITV